MDLIFWFYCIYNIETIQKENRSVFLVSLKSRPAVLYLSTRCFSVFVCRLSAVTGTFD